MNADLVVGIDIYYQKLMILVLHMNAYVYSPLGMLSDHALFMYGT